MDAPKPQNADAAVEAKPDHEDVEMPAPKTPKPRLRFLLTVDLKRALLEWRLEQVAISWVQIFQ